MWLFSVGDVWEPLPIDGVRSTEFAIRMLARTKQLLGEGEYWRGEAMATTVDGEVCNPLAPEAAHFSLGGAAARARWEMREELAAAEVRPDHMRQVMNALFSVAREYRLDRGGWTFASAVLDGLRGALEEYRVEQLGEVHRGEVADATTH